MLEIQLIFVSNMKRILADNKGMNLHRFIERFEEGIRHIRSSSKVEQA